MVRDRVTVRGGVATDSTPLEAVGLLSWVSRGVVVCVRRREKTSLAGMRRETVQLVPSSWYWERTLIKPVCAWTKVVSRSRRQLSHWAYI